MLIDAFKLYTYYLIVDVIEPLKEMQIFKNENQNKINLLNYSQFIKETGLLINDISSKYNLPIGGINLLEQIYIKLVCIKISYKQSNTSCNANSRFN